MKNLTKLTRAELIDWLASVYVDHHAPSGHVPALTTDRIVDVARASGQWLAGFAMLEPADMRPLMIAISQMRLGQLPIERSYAAEGGAR